MKPGVYLGIGLSMGIVLLLAALFAAAEDNLTLCANTTALALLIVDLGLFGFLWPTKAHWDEYGFLRIATLLLFAMGMGTAFLAWIRWDWELGLLANVFLIGAFLLSLFDRPHPVTL